jgi:hypothetical protein
LKLGLEDAREGDAQQGGPSESGGGADGIAAALAAREDHGCDGEAFGSLCKKTAMKMTVPSQVEMRNPAAMATPSKKA